MSTAVSARDVRASTAQPQNPSSEFFRADEQLVRLNLSDVAVPQVGGLEVEGFKPSWLQRLFGRR